MTGIAQQSNAAHAPARQRIAFEDRPFVTIGTCIEHGAHVGMKTRVGGAQFLDIAFGRPRFFGRPAYALGQAGDAIDFVALGGGVVNESMPVPASPLVA